VADNPTDPAAYLTLGQAYSRALGATRERVWTAGLQQIGRLRQIQAVTAYRRAVALSTGREAAVAHLRLGRMYEQLGVLDGAYTHLSKFRELAAQAGRPDDDEPAGGLPTDAELRQLGGHLAEQTKQYEEESVRTRVFDRALMAVRRGLVVRGLEVLLGSDIAAFGARGLDLEVDLLLRTGRADDVIAWVSDDSLKATLGSDYHWHRAQALAATGRYKEADAELLALSGEDRPFLPPDAADTFSRQVQLAIYDGATGGPLFPDVVFRAFNRGRFEEEVFQLVSRMTDRANGLTLRGLVALEAGDIPTAEAAYRSALLYTGGPTGGLRFGGQPVAEAGLEWITAANRSQ
jgi:tetratricopeptide (TPR) repeat protein